MVRSFGFLIICWLLCVCPIIANENERSNESIYSTALTAGMEEMAKQYGHINDGIPGQKIRTDYKNMFVQKDRFITGDLPQSFGSFHIQYLDESQLIEKYKRLKLDFPVLVIQPAEVEDARIKVTINVYWVSYKKRMLQLGLSDWSTSYFRFACEKKRFVLDEVKLGGI